jgi:hypothetical protein
MVAAGQTPRRGCAEKRPDLQQRFLHSRIAAAAASIASACTTVHSRGCSFCFVPSCTLRMILWGNPAAVSPSGSLNTEGFASSDHGEVARSRATSVDDTFEAYLRSDFSSQTFSSAGVVESPPSATEQVTGMSSSSARSRDVRQRNNHRRVDAKRRKKEAALFLELQHLTREKSAASSKETAMSAKRSKVDVLLDCVQELTRLRAAPSATEVRVRASSTSIPSPEHPAEPDCVIPFTSDIHPLPSSEIAPAWPFPRSYDNEIIHRVTSQLQACDSTTPSGLIDAAYVLAHVMEALPQELFSSLLASCGYAPILRPGTGSQKWQSTRWPMLPIISHIHRHCLDWSASLEQCAVEDSSALSFPTLTIHGAMSFDQGTASATVRSSLESTLFASGAAIDASSLRLPSYVEVNGPFERFFGYSQAEIRAQFMRQGKRALFLLSANPQALKQISAMDLEDAFDGVKGNANVFQVRRKYGGCIWTVLHTKFAVAGVGFAFKKTFVWAPVPNFHSCKAYLESVEHSTVREPPRTNPSDRHFFTGVSGTTQRLSQHSLPGLHDHTLLSIPYTTEVLDGPLF